VLSVDNSWIEQTYVILTLIPYITNKISSLLSFPNESRTKAPTRASTQPRAAHIFINDE